MGSLKGQEVKEVHPIVPREDFDVPSVNSQGSPEELSTRIYKSLSAGSDLDRLRELVHSEEEHRRNHQSLANLRLILPSNSTQCDSDRSPGSSRRVIRPPPPSQSLEAMTASLQSIHRLADSVENLRDRLAVHAGVQLFRAREEKEKVGAITRACEQQFIFYASLLF